MDQDAAFEEGVELVLHELRQVGSGGGFGHGLGKEGRRMLLHQAVQRGLLGAATHAVDGGAIRLPVGLLNRCLHAFALAAPRRPLLFALLFCRADAITAARPAPWLRGVLMFVPLPRDA